MTLDEIISQSDQLLHNSDVEPSPVDALRLVNHLAMCLQRHMHAISHTARTGG